MAFESRRISVLDVDPDVAHLLRPKELPEARRAALVRVLALPVGDWPGGPPAPSPGGFGHLVLEGLLVRSSTLLGRTTTELIGPEDLITPWGDGADIAQIPMSTDWSVQQPTRLAVLDVDFSRRISAWPSINAALIARSARRARRLAFHVAMLENPRLDVRLLLLFWHLAGRWGRVGPDGVSIRIDLTHRTVGRLVRAQRPSVTASLRRLADRGMLTRPKTGLWVLHGEPDQQLRMLLSR